MAVATSLDQIVPALMSADMFSLDIETTGFDPRKDRIKGITLSIGTGGDPRDSLISEETWWLPFMGTGALPFIPTMRALAPVLSDPSKTLIGSNPKFDLKFLKKNGVDVLCRLACTVIASWLTDENATSHGLKQQVERHFGYKMMTYEDAAQHEHDLFGNEKWIRYVHDDGHWARRLFLEKLLPLLQEQGLEKLFWSVEMEVTRLLIEMELTGIAIDLDYLRDLKVRIEKEMVEDKAKSFKIVEHPFNIDSPVEISKLLFQEQKIPPLPGQAPGKNGQYSTADDVLTKYPQDQYPIIASVLKYRHAAHTMSTYVTPYLERADESRIFAEFNQAGTVAYRFTSSGPNLQQIPAQKGYVKKMFVSPPGKKLVVGDWNQLQFRLIGHFSNRWLGHSGIADAYLEGKDLHRKTMEELGFDKKYPDDKVKARREAKITNFAFLFGRGWKAFGESENMEPETAKSYYKGFHRAYPEIRLCANRCREDICDHGYVESLTRRRRRFPHCVGLDSNPDNRESEAWWDGYKAWNSVIQASEGDLVRIAMRNIYRDIRERRKTSPIWRAAHVLVQVHDELVSEVPDEIADEYAAMVKHHAESALKLDVPIIFEVGVGTNWETAKP